MKKFDRLLLLSILLLAMLLRTPTLTSQSLWLDEVYAEYFTNSDFLTTARRIIAPEHNGPLYFLLLWGWRQLASSSDFALRYLSVSCSILTLAPLWQLARQWFNKRIAGYAALLWAIAPFSIWYAQEAKMYALHILLATSTTLFLAHALKYNQWRWWIAYGIGINLLGYSHFFGAFTIAAHGVLTLLTTWKTPRILRNYLLTIALVALPYIPIVRFVLRILPHFSSQDITKGFVPFHLILKDMGIEFTMRLSMLLLVPAWRLLIPLAILLSFGLLTAWRRGKIQGLWLVGMLTLPVLFFYPVSYQIPVYSAKYFSAIFPFFILALACALEGLLRLWKPALWGGLALMIGFAGWRNAAIFTQPDHQRTDWRAVAQYLETHTTPQDVILVFSDYSTYALERYYTGAAKIIPFGADPYQPEDFYDYLQQEHAIHALWLILHHDQAMAPHHRLSEAAGGRYPAITGLYPNQGQITVLGYSAAWHHAQLPGSAIPVNAQFENGLTLIGYMVDATRLRATDRLFHPPSNWIHVTTYWQVEDTAPPLDFTPFVRLVDVQGGVWGGELQRIPTAFHFTPPELWTPRHIMEAHYDVNLNPITPPGYYSLVVGLEKEGGVRVPLVDSASEAALTAIEIVR